MTGQLPDRFAAELQRQPETGMSYWIVTVWLHDGRRFDQVVVTDGCVTRVRGYADVPFEPTDVERLTVTHKKWDFSEKSPFKGSGYEVRGRRLRLLNGSEAKFRFPIAECAPCGDLLIVCLRVPVLPFWRTFNENVYAVTGAGEVAWQIESIPLPHRQSPYVGITCVDGIVRAQNWAGVAVDVDPATGKIVGRILTK